MNILLSLLIVLSLPGALLAGYSKDAIQHALLGSGGFTVSNFITSPLDISGADVTGTLPTENGGTEATSLSSGQVLVGGGTGPITATSTTNLKASMFLNLVENTALSTWAGSANLTTAGTITTGTWNAGGVTSSGVFASTNTTGTSTIANALGVGTTTPAATGHKLMIQGSAAVQEIKVATSSSITIDWNTGNQKMVGLGAATTITFANGYPGGAYRLEICQDGTGSRTVTWPGGGVILWAGGTAPTLTATADKCDWFSFLYTNGTSTPKYHGAATQNF